MKVTQLSTSGTRPRWADDFGDRRTLLHGGAKLDAASFPLVNGKRTVVSGTAISKAYNGATFHPAVAGEEIIGFVWQDVDDAAVNNDVEVYIAGTVKVNFLPAAPAAGILADLKRQFTLTQGS